MRRFWPAFWRALQELSGEAALKRALDGEPACCPAGAADRSARAKQVARELERRFSGVNRCC